MLPSFALSPTPLSWDITINAFLQLKRLSGFSPSTLEWYEVTFRLLKRFHDEHQLLCPSPCLAHLSTYKPSFSGSPAKTAPSPCPPNSAPFVPSSVGSPKKACARQSYHKSHAPKVNEPLPKTVNEDHFAKVLNATTLSRFA
jgi:hypothetical protein